MVIPKRMQGEEWRLVEVEKAGQRLAQRSDLDVRNEKKVYRYSRWVSISSGDGSLTGSFVPAPYREHGVRIAHVSPLHSP